MSGTSREAALGRVRAALERTAVRAEERCEWEAARLVGAEGLLERFRTMAVDAGMVVHEAGDAAQAGRVVAGIVRQVEAERVLMDRAEFVARGEVLVALAEAGVAAMMGDVGDEELFSAEVGIAGARWGIAETGSVVLAGGPDVRRLISLVPPCHIVVLEEGQILPDLLDWAKKEGGGESGGWRYQVLISGPSKTGDIELVLVTGVHGPGHLWVGLLSDL